MLFHRDADVPNPMSDDEATAQVIDVGRQLRTVAVLQDVSGGFSFQSCNDQGSRRTGATWR